MADGKTVYETRFGVQFDGPVIPFGANVSCQPICSKDESSPYQFGKKMLTGILLAYGMGVGRQRSGDLLIADREDLKNLSTPEFHVRSFQHQEVSHEETPSFPSVA